MNKWKTAFFTLSLVLFILSTTAFAGSLSIPNMSGEKGDVVEIPIDVNNAVSMAGFQITVNYDPAVLDCTRAVPSELTKGWSVTANPTEGQVKIGGFDPTLSGPSGSGTIVKLVCTVIGDSQKKTEIRISSRKLTDSKGAEIKSSSTDGIFKVKKGREK